MITTPALTVAGLSKTFAGQRALDDVSFSIADGAITALLGMNGSGKSTLIKILAGVYSPDPGAALTVRGDELALPLQPSDAHRAGLRFLHQDLGLVDALTVADNFALTDGFFAAGTLAPINRRKQERHTSSTLERFEIDVRPTALIRDLPPATRTMVGIARAFQDGDDAVRRNLLILDEPTASLPAEEVERVLGMLERLRAAGGTAIYVSHRIDEVRRIADRLLVLRDGQLVADEPLGARDNDDIVSLVIGRPLARVEVAAPAEREGEVVLSATGLRGSRLTGIDLAVRSGEIVGVTGLIGCGRSELIRMLAGAQKPDAGTMTLASQPYAPGVPADAVGLGVGCVPQDRRAEGIVADMSVGENLTLGRLDRFRRAGSIDRAAEREASAGMAAEYLVKARSLDVPIRTLSGGNQQKVVVARAASPGVRVLLLDQPSQGVDALAKQEIGNILRSLAESGVAIVVASTDYADFVGLADRVLVLNRGRLAVELGPGEITEDSIALACTAQAA
ncbi:sugar ABC transporter ATP-binding protein [Diaminobutyricimonas sp. TR449]|uniref:sugar ABC transporter ATP-binding protein n=1 Tax=Diaminobutyricimonas sp. TR449 TaxID=2708076 RepID=UPI00142117BF|nr:sugar ABC transporter ATP-binding protein [Diaminobutyricimonas sp. TR449]